MKNVLVLGGGRVGSAIAYDLSKEYKVTVADIDVDTLNSLKKEYSINTINQDFSDLNRYFNWKVRTILNVS